MRWFALVPVTLVGLTVGLSGCATAPADSPPPATAALVPSDLACLTGHNPVAPRQQAEVRIEAIDGYPTDGDEPYCPSPGRHCFDLRTYAGHQVAAGVVELELAGGTLYWLRAQPSGSRFSFQLIDITRIPGQVRAMIRCRGQSRPGSGAFGAYA